jgi:DNA-binding response OmpR family regulator
MESGKADLRRSLLGGRAADSVSWRDRTMIEFRILGPFEVVEGDRRLALGGPKQRAVLAILLLHRGEVVATDRLIDELWGERPPARAAKSLRCTCPTCARCSRSG